MKGMVFVGCSFTHGHGLWHYANFPNMPIDDTSDDRKYSFIKYSSLHRFPRLVANHFNTWEFVRNDYSGDDEESVGLLNKLFKIDKRIYYYNQDDVYQFSDISHVIFQTSYIDRCPYIYNKKTKDRFHITELDEESQIDMLLEWGFENIEDYYETLKIQWYSEIRNLFKILESKGLKCYLLSITDDYLKLLENDSFMKNKFIEMEYGGSHFKTISELMDYESSLKISNDFVNFENPPQDFHPSKKCHKIIADSIIKKIEKNG
jgi:hypothetical protein